MGGSYNPTKSSMIFIDGNTLFCTNCFDMGIPYKTILVWLKMHHLGTFNFAKQMQNILYLSLRGRQFVFHINLPCKNR